MKKTLIILILALIFTACGDNKHEISCEFRGGVILGTYGEYTYDIKYDNEIIYYVKGYQIDAGYQVGDTIDRPCIGWKIAEKKTHGNNY